MKILEIFDRQQTRKIKRAFLKRLANWLIDAEKVPEFELGIHLIGADEMARINQQYLNHSGSTDVITFDHGTDRARIHGELFVCVDVALTQAAEFRTSWQHEMVRYICHGILHLRGFTDEDPAARRTMKRRENALMRELESQFDLTLLGYG